jgi:hypothetical protein
LISTKRISQARKVKIEKDHRFLMHSIRMRFKMFVFFTFTFNLNLEKSFTAVRL